MDVAVRLGIRKLIRHPNTAVVFRHRARWAGVVAGILPSAAMASHSAWRAARNIIRCNVKDYGDRNTYKALKDPPGKPMTFVTTDEGDITADPEVVDELARRTWKEVYDGTGGDEDEVVQHFMRVYEQYNPPGRAWGRT